MTESRGELRSRHRVQSSEKKVVARLQDRSKTVHVDMSSWRTTCFEIDPVSDVLQRGCQVAEIQPLAPQGISQMDEAEVHHRYPSLLSLITCY